jgi:MoaA/NifB/PqqE/SkfB family radical SAM enzyme
MSPDTNNDGKFCFYGRLKKEFPSQVIADITEKCNLSCIHCQHREFVKSPHYHALEMDDEINTKMVQEIRENGKGLTQYIRYTSDGEPLLHRHAYEFILEAIQDSGVSVTLTSNGTRINQSKMRTLFDEGLFLIDISVDAYSPETYEKIRVGGCLEKTKENIMNMIKYRDNSGSKTRIVVSFIEQPENFHEAKRFKKFWEETGADFVVIRRLHSHAGAIERIVNELNDQINREQRKPCVYPWERILLKPDGSLHFCPSSWSNEDYIGDFHKTSIKDVWTGKQYDELRQAHVSGHLFDFGICYRCPDWMQTRWPGEGRSYASLINDFRIKNERE